MKTRGKWWKRKRWIWGIYLLLLGLHQWGGFSDLRGHDSPRGLGVQVPRAEGSRDRVEVRITEDGAADAPVLLLVAFDSDTDSELDAQLRALVRDHRIRIWQVDLRALAQEVSPPSFEGLASRLRAVVEAEGSPPLSMVATADAAAVAIHCASELDPAPQALVLWGGSGVQEFDLLGSHELNHVLYSLQWVLLTASNELLPHFGALPFLAHAAQNARIRMQSDRRLLRDAIRRLGMPVLIVHRARDPHVGVAVAREHARLIPQARLQVLGPGSTAPSLGEWLDEARRGEIPRRSDATAERIEASRAELGRGEWVQAHGRTLGLLIFLLVLGTFITEDLTSIAAGLLIADGRLTWAQGLGAVFCGIYFGDQSLYLIGRIARRNIVHRRPWKWVLRGEDLDRAARWFEEKGLVAILLTRFIPGTRLPTYVAAGVVRAGYWRFAAYFFVAVALWTPLLVGFSAQVGGEALARLQGFRRGSLLVLAVVALVILVCLRLLLPLFTDRGRRELWARWQRWTRWEFWPPAMIYGPVLVRILGFAWRHRSLRVVTAVNPGIAAGGLMGESKLAILDALGGEGEHVPPYQRIPPGDARSQREVAEAFLSRADVGLPIVIKPDSGERGQGVVVVRRLEQLDEVLRGSGTAWIAQRYVEGLEFGIFYLREPGESAGRIFSMNSKERLCLRGDGIHDLEHLVLHDPRASILAKIHLRANVDRLGSIPAEGEEVEIVEIGAHARGTVFRDARDLVTPELTRAIDRLSRRFSGFHFGRYDVRVPDVEALREGRDFQVLELNGLTSEAAHIYEPGFSLREARRTLTEQWRLAFEIGAANAAEGHRPSTWRELLDLWSQYREAARQRPPAH